MSLPFLYFYINFIELLKYVSKTYQAENKMVIFDRDRPILLFWGQYDTNVWAIHGPIADNRYFQNF